jgi:internalin A
MVRVSSLIDDVREIAQPEADPKATYAGFTFNAPIQRLIIDQSGGTVVKNEERDNQRVSSAWANGLFYLVVFVVIFAVLGFFARMLPLYAMALIIFGGIVLIPLVGALQLRQDQNLSEKSFMELIRIVIGQLPLLSRFVRSGTAASGGTPGETSAHLAPDGANNISSRSRRRPPSRSRPRWRTSF